MDKRIERSIDENTHLSEEFRFIAKICFGRIFDMLGKRNFERWINKRDLSSRIKELVIESMGPEDEREHPNWAGYYTRGTNRIRLRTTSSRDVATHEKFHFITDNGKGFPTFIDEGLTEYMKGMADGGANTYSENVATVKFLHEMFGDSIIKAYLLGQPRIFDNKIALALVNGNDSEKFKGLEKVTDFYKNLDVFHTYSYTKNKHESALLNSEDYSQEELDKMESDATKAKNAYQQVKDKIPDMFEKIVVARVTQMAQKLEFYRDGKLDLEFASKRIEEITKSIPLSYFEDYFTKREEIGLQIMKSAARVVVENSHLVAYDEGEARERKIDSFVTKMLPEVQITKYQVTRSPSKFKNDDPILEAENKDVVKKLLHVIASDNLDITTYLERLANLQEKFDIPDTTMEYILTKHNADRFTGSPVLSNINQSIIKNFPLFRTLSKMSDDREKDTIESTYRAIGDNRYIELRDNQRFFIEIDENGEIYEEELKYGHSVIFRGRERIDISYKNGMDDFEVSDRHGRIKPHYPISLQELKELEFGKIVTKGIFDKISKREFVTVLNDAPNPYSIEGINYTNEVDARSREVNWDEFLQEIQNYDVAIPESVKLHLINKMASELLDKTYGFGPRKNEAGAYVRQSDVLDIHFDVWDQLDVFFQKDATPSMKEMAKKKLSGASSKLNDLRKARVSETAKTALLSFETPEAQKRYFELQDKEKQIELDKKIKEFAYRDYLEIEDDNDENLAFRLKGVYTTADIDTRNRKLLVGKFAEGTKSLLKDLPESQREDTFDLIFSKMMRTAYGVGTKQLETDRELQRHFEIVKRAISRNVFLGEELEEENLSKSLNEFNLFHKNQAKENKKVAAVAFKDDNARKMYDVVMALSKDNVSLSDLQNQVKKLVEIHNGPTKDASSNSEKNLPEDK